MAFHDAPSTLSTLICTQVTAPEYTATECDIKGTEQKVRKNRTAKEKTLATVAVPRTAVQHRANRFATTKRNSQGVSGDLVQVLSCRNATSTLQAANMQIVQLW